jgi:ankyrin repeat protein
MSSLPKSLDETYSRILDSIDEDDWKDALKILQWLVFSARPLRIEELAEVLTVNTEVTPAQFDAERRFLDPRDILDICSSLVTTVVEIHSGDGGDFGQEVELVRLAHFSVKEYLVSEQIRSGRTARYSIQEIPANTSIAEICLAYLLQFDKAKSLTNEALEDSHLASYAAGYWTQHAQVAEDNGRSIMHLMIMDLFLARKEAFLNWIRMCDPDYPWRKPQLDLVLKEDISPLYYAALTGLYESVRILLEQGVDINSKGRRGGTALQAASAQGHAQIVQLLIDQGADINAQEGYYGSALQAASSKGRIEIVQLLIHRGADINAQGEEHDSALQEASSHGHIQIVHLLIEQGADVNAQGGYYGNALQAASFCGYIQIARLLVEQGADINAQGGEYGNALQAASRWKHAQIVQLLVDQGADINAPGGYYGNALQAASCQGHAQTVQLLIDQGADINAQGGYFGSALQAASASGNIEVIQLLIDQGADINARGGYHRNALQAAADSPWSSTETAQLLLDRGISLEFYAGALQAALRRGRDGIVHHLREKIASVDKAENTES